MRVARFGTIPTEAKLEGVLRTRRGRALVRITHASVGVTDVQAIRGEYLMQPVRGFVPGYDFIGIVEHLSTADHPQLSVGQRVAGILPRMGAHATRVTVAESLLVPVPDGLDSAVAATAPLDGVTARFALDALGAQAGPVLIQGAGGAVGAWTVQLAAARNLTVLGTASTRSRAFAESLGAMTFDYHDPNWIDMLCEATHGGVTGLIDHTGSAELRRAVRPNGRIVRIAFAANRGHQRWATAAGFAAAAVRRYAHPSERVCSTPLLVQFHRAAYRAALGDVLSRLATGTLAAPQPRCYRSADYRDAVTDTTSTPSGEKNVLVLG
jgi:NADPH2:quinone reductase